MLRGEDLKNYFKNQSSNKTYEYTDAMTKHTRVKTSRQGSIILENFTTQLLLDHSTFFFFACRRSTCGVWQRESPDLLTSDKSATIVTLYTYIENICHVSSCGHVIPELLFYINNNLFKFCPQFCGQNLYSVCARVGGGYISVYLCISMYIYTRFIVNPGGRQGTMDPGYVWLACPGFSPYTQIISESEQLERLLDINIYLSFAHVYSVLRETREESQNQK